MVSRLTDISNLNEIKQKKWSEPFVELNTDIWLKKISKTYPKTFTTTSTGKLWKIRESEKQMPELLNNIYEKVKLGFDV